MLKRGVRLHDAHHAEQFPSVNRRGNVEATARRALRRTRVGFPSVNRRGNVEALRSSRGARRAARCFPRSIAEVMLKHPRPDRAIALRQRFPRSIAEVMLKLDARVPFTGVRDAFPSVDRRGNVEASAGRCGSTIPGRVSLGQSPR